MNDASGKARSPGLSFPEIIRPAGRLARPAALLLWLALPAAASPPPGTPPLAGRPPAPRETTIAFDRAVGNLAYAAQRLWPAPPPNVRRSREVQGAAWYGWIMRRLPGDVAALGKEHFVPFLVEYRDGVASAAWCDANMNGDLTDDPPLALSVRPEREGARSFLADLVWDRPDGAAPGARFERLVRIVLEPAPADGGEPGYQAQMVHVMMGTVTLQGREHRALLLDGDGDGLYTRSLMDGLFVDLDDDGHIDVDQMSAEFGSLRVPFTLGDRAYEVSSIDPEGRQLTLREIGPADPLPPAPVAGRPAPDFAFDDLEGRPHRLSGYRGHPVIVYFWASWCPACREQAEALVRLYASRRAGGLEILGVSYDTDRRALEAFRRDHDERWPTSFSGRQLWEDPAGRLWRQRDVGVLHLIAPDGTLEGTYGSIPALAARLDSDGPR